MELSEMEFKKYLHSTLIKYKAYWFRKQSYSRCIYIPLWLNIKDDKGIFESDEGIIYIPLWLNIKASLVALAFQASENLHSTLIKYKGYVFMLKVFNYLDLHSTLIKYKVVIIYINVEKNIYLHSTLIKYKAKHIV